MKQFRYVYPTRKSTSKWLTNEFTLEEIILISKEMKRYDKEFYIEYREVA